MARIYPLFSSSKGNSTFIGTEKGGILIDAGTSCKRLVKALDANNIPMEAVKAIFITHEHSDHTKGLRVFTSKSDCAVYGQKKTLQNIINSGNISSHTAVIEMPNRDISVCDMEIKCFNTPHDTVQSCGYRIHTSDDKYCAVCTDLGHITPEVHDALTGCKLVLLESNYDENMLRFGNYPLHLKQRILAKTGHLSNVDCADEIKKLIESGTLYFILGHLSQENNMPSIADMCTQNTLKDFKRNTDYFLGVAPVESSGGAVIF